MAGGVRKPGGRPADVPARGALVAGNRGLSRSVRCRAACYRKSMRTVRGKVVRGKVVTRAKLPEGAKLTVFVHEPDAVIELDSKDEAAIARGTEEIRAGNFATAADLRARLRRR